MEDIDQIRSRIQEKEEPHQKENKESKLLKFFNAIFICFFLILTGLIYCKTDENGVLLNRLFHVNVSFKSFNESIFSYLNKLFFFEEDVNTPVALLEEYVSLGKNHYTTEDKNITSLRNGNVVSITNQEQYQFFVIIEYDNGVSASYSYLDEVIVKQEQTIEINQIIGSYSGEYFNCVFQKDGKVVTYNDAL